jgi:hypothetical protein
VWLCGGTLEDVPEKDRDPSLWKFVQKYGPVQLRMMWEGTLDGRDELLAAGVDFTRLEGVDEDDVTAVRAGGSPGPRPQDASQRRGNLSLPKEVVNRSSV